MKKIILGTAGHIDHGKTTLMKALTGVDLDRLKEEKQRGITIELGFTSLALPSGQKIGIIDVPGHEKFIKNMVAGVGGIDLVLMVIAADEGVMPQTREHLDICKLLNIQKGLIALTKADLVDAEWLDLAREDIKEFVMGTFLAEAPIIPVSSVDGQGIPDLLSALDAIVAAIEERPATGIFRLPIDRIFTMKGFGSVITGTLMAGTIAVGNEVEILPSGVRAKVRGIQVHNENVASVGAGLRTAINLQGVEKDSVKRGDVLTIPETALPTKRADAWLEYLPGAQRPLKNRNKIRFHCGTSEIIGEVRILNKEEISAGQAGYIQLVLGQPVVVFPHDRYVLRSYSPVQTIGGGEILSNHPARHKRFAKEVIASLEVLKKGDIKQALLLICQEAGPSGLDLYQLQARLGIQQERLKTLIERMIAQDKLIGFNKNPLQITLPDYIQEIESCILETLQRFHEKNPLKAGTVKEELKSKMPHGTNPRLFAFVVEQLICKRKLTLAKEFLFLPDHKPVLKDTQKDLRQRMLALYSKGGITPPTRKELLTILKVDEKEAAGLLRLLVQEGALIKLNDDLYYDGQSLNRLKQDILTALAEKGEMTAQGFKELTGLSRKFTIPLLEYFDKAKLTVRIGDKRILRKERPAK